ncbi:MAG: hypothetical protein IJN82_02225 [Clostridia bacterium]|nr:hypothetical protein [Clostridia bacterium]
MQLSVREIGVLLLFRFLLSRCFKSVPNKSGILICRAKRCIRERISHFMIPHQRRSTVFLSAAPCAV